VFVTTRHFTGPARATAERLPQRLVLIDGEELSRLLLRYGVGVRTVTSVTVRKIDLEYFEAEEV
jgi:restriction system protein